MRSRLGTILFGTLERLEGAYIASRYIEALSVGSAPRTCDRCNEKDDIAADMIAVPCAC